MAIYKNIASQKIAVYAHDTSADTAKTGDAANITAQISKDGGVTAATNDTNPTELDATDAPGVYLFDMTQAETNADLVIVSAVSSTADISLEPVIIYTLPTWANTQTAQTGDSYTRLGAPAGASVSADIAVIDGNADSILTDTGTTIPAQISGLNNLSAAQVNAEVDTALADYDAPTKAELDSGLAGLNDPTAAAIRTEIDSNSTQLAAIVADTNELQGDWVNGGRLDLILDELTTQGDTNEGKIDTVDTVVDAVLVDTGTTIPAQISGLNNLSAAQVNAEVDTALADYDPPTKAELDSGLAALNDVTVADILTTQMTESYAGDGVAPTLAQALFLIQQQLGDFAISGTTLTVKKIDGSTTAATFTLNDATTPTSVTRAT
jgi:hypothetical protein